ncbi:hypothetical protein [Mesorhizobium sp. B2-4-3]|uniref:hypothetical protein n=1 Tax=Mesorhizobium sp. B2-4-3 TaxID=2589946 RepID=UPI00112EEB62|nr:hypothetical protein [Mesorhizobium sp. B2-4-3]TPL73233.1 hypothetical protein FJ956_10370 [Mesorhizobium sp. B2-4-3]
MTLPTSVDWSNDAGICKGFSYRYQSIKGSCFTPESMVSEDELSYETVALKTERTIRLIEDSESLAQALGVSASAAFATPTGIGGSATASFARDHSCDQNSVYVLGSLEAITRPQNLSAAQIGSLTVDPRALTKIKTSPISFFDTFGESFVSGWVRGASLHVLLELQSHSVTDKMNLSAEVSGNAGSFSGSAKFTGQLDAISKGRNVNFYILQTGGPRNLNWSDPTAATILAKLDAFDNGLQSADTHFPLRATLTPYRNLLAFNEVDFGNIDNIFSQLESLAKVRLWLNDRLALLSYMSKFGTQFLSALSPAQITAAQRTLLEGSSFLEKEMRRVSQLSSLASADFQSEEDIRERPELKPSIDLVAGLPPRWMKLPTSASDIYRMMFDPASNRAPPDQEYPIFLDANDSSSSVDLYCVFPKDGSLPRSYITLRAAGDANSSYWPASPKSSNGICYFRRGDSLRTTYTKIAFDPQTMLVGLQDTTFATTKGTSLLDTRVGNVQVQTFHHADYATASASNHMRDVEQQDHRPFGTANVDLTGTPFQIDPSVEWGDGGKSVSWATTGGYVEKPGPANMYQRCSVQVGGAPASFFPQTGLKLRKLQVNPPSSDKAQAG